jgi:hypothetical protein
MSKPRPGSKLDQFMAYLTSHSTLEILDLRSVLQQAKKVGGTYHMTDSHWNQYGAFIASNEVIQRLSKQMLWLKPPSLKCFYREASEGPAGNLAWMLTGKYNLIERDCPTLRPRAPLPVLSVTREEGSWATVRNPERKGKVIIFCDSFADGLLPFLAFHFNEVSLYRLYMGPHSIGLKQSSPAHPHIWKAAIIEQEKPDLVIDEILGSLLYIEDPASIKREDALE